MEQREKFNKQILEGIEAQLERRDRYGDEQLIRAVLAGVADNKGRVTFNYSHMAEAVDDLELEDYIRTRMGGILLGQEATIVDGSVQYEPEHKVTYKLR